MHKILHVITENKLTTEMFASGKPQNILLIREAIYLALRPFPANISNNNFYLLEDDWLARCGQHKLDQTNVILVNTAQFVELCCKHDVIVTW